MLDKVIGQKIVNFIKGRLKMIVDLDKTYRGQDGKLYYKQEPLVLAILKGWIVILLMMISLLITHELGHMSGYFLFNIDFEFFLFEPAIYNHVDYGIAMGFMRWERVDLLGELYIRIIGPVLFNIILLLSIYKLKKSLFDIPLIIWILVAFFLLYGDLAVLITDIELGLL